MHEFRRTIHIDRSPDVVWPYLTEADKIQQLANLEAIEQEPEGAVETGTRWHQTVRLLGKKMETADEAVAIEKPRRLAVRSIESPFPYMFEYTLEQEVRGTNVVLDVGIGETKGFFGKLAEPVVARIMEHEFRGQLERLKTLVEAGAD